MSLIIINNQKLNISWIVFILFIIHAPITFKLFITLSLTKY